GCLGTPDDLVEDRKEDEEQTPAQGELAPAVVVHSDRFTHDKFEEKLAKSKAAKEKRAEQSIDQRHLHLDEGVIVKPKRERAENSHETGGNKGCHRELAGEKPGSCERENRRR